MPIAAVCLIPALEDLDDLVCSSELMLAAGLWALAIMIVYVVVQMCVDRFSKRSPVEKLMKRKFG